MLEAKRKKYKLSCSNAYEIEMAATETVQNRIDFAIGSLTPKQVALGLSLITLTTALLLFAQDPLVHDSMHNFRHTAGITCH